MRQLIAFLSRWQVLPPLVIAGMALFAAAIAFVGHDAARLVRDVDPTEMLEMRVERLDESGTWPRVIHATGRMPYEEVQRSVRVYRQDVPRIVATGRLEVMATGVLDEPLVLKRWYDDQGFVRMGSVVLTWHYLAALIAAALVVGMIVFRRNDLRRIPRPSQGFDLAPEAMRVDPRYAPLVARLEQAAHADPDGYRRRVVAAGFLGYAVLGGAVIVTAGAGVVCAWIAIAARAGLLLKFVLPLLVLSGAVLRSLWVRVPPPTGRPLPAAEAPGLFALIETLRREMKGPELHEVLLVDSFNAAIVQRPRFGIFGWNRNTLIIGLQLALAMSPQEFATVVAHEYGHLAGAHGRLAAWVYRLRLIWSRLAADLARRGGWTSAPLRRFFAWYAPWFNAYSFVLARANEFAADRMAAAATAPAIAGDALLRAEIVARHLDAVVWPRIAGSARRIADPPPAFSAIAAVLAAGVDESEAARHLQAALQKRTGLHDTHPAVGDRLGALGCASRVPPPPSGSAAAAMFGDALDGLIAECDAAWQAAVADRWADMHETAATERARLAELESRDLRDETDRGLLWERAVLTERERGPEEAVPVLRALLALAPDHAGAQFALGRILLAQDDPGGIEPLERAMAIDPDAVAPACELAAAFLSSRDETAAQSYRERAAVAHAEQAAAAAERASLDNTSQFEPHALCAQDRAAVARVLAADPAVARAWLVRKSIRLRPDLPVHVAIVRFRPFSRRRRPNVARDLAGALASLGIRGEFWVLPADLLNWRLVRRGRLVAGAPLDLGR